LRRFDVRVDAADVDATVARAERALGRDVVFGREPDHLTRGGIQAGRQAVVLRGQSTASPLAGRETEERGVVELAVQEAQAAIVAATAVLGEVFLPDELAGVQIPGPQQRPNVP